MQLDLLNIHQIRAKRLGHHNTVAGSARGIGSHRTLQIRPVLGVHFLIGAEAARRKDDRLAVEYVVAVLSFCLYAADLSVRICQQFGCFRIVHGLHAQLIQLGAEALHQELTHTGTVRRGMNPVHGCAAGEGNLRQFRADGIQPVNGIGGFLRHHFHQGRIIQVMAALDGIRSKQLNRVFNFLFLLIMGFRGVHAAGRLGGVAACIGHLLQQYEILARLLHHDSRGHSGAAGTDDYNPGVNNFFFLASLFTDIPAVCVQHGNIRARRCQGLRCGLDHGVAGNRRAAHSVYIRGLGFHNLCGQHACCHTAQRFSFVCSVNQYGGNFRFVHCDQNLHGAQHSLCFSLIGSGSKQGFRGRRFHQCGYGEQHDYHGHQQADQFFHDGPPPRGFRSSLTGFFPGFHSPRQQPLLKKSSASRL